jgi:PBSX family phage terminase large subunit
MQDPFSKKQLEYIKNSDKLWNLAHGAVSTGKTVCTTFRFLEAVNSCPDSEIAIIGKTSTTLYNNVIKLILESPELSMFRPFCSWSSSKHELHFKDKTIATYGAKDESSYQLIQGRTLSLALCDEMTLYPTSFIEMLETRLRKPHSMAFAAMNPSHPTHRIHQWIDKAKNGDPEYYALHFVLDDNPYLTDAYKQRTKQNNSGLFYKRNVLGLWVLSEGCIFDFFDKNIHVVNRAPRGAEYFIAGIDYGLNNPYACVLLGVSTGRSIQEGKILWVEDEYYYDHKKHNRQKTVSELARDTANFLEPYNVKQLYIDPSALPIKLDLQKVGVHPVDANNEVLEGIGIMCSEMSKGNLVVMDRCKNLIREIESYVWDNKASAKGYDEPIKKDDHAVDALRYAIATHKVPTYQPYKQGHNPEQYNQSRFQPTRRSIF